MRAGKWVAAGRWLLLMGAVVAAGCSSTSARMGRATHDPEQIPLCMVGDSITWAGHGDCWRQYLVERIPRLAFVGTHSARLGYSHAGEGGNTTSNVLDRMEAIPASPYYALLIGTNDNNIGNAGGVAERADRTAGRIQAIVERLLDKPGTRTVFLGSVLPCFTKNPLRDTTNAATNVRLRKWLEIYPRKKRVVWVEYEHPIRATDGWEKLIELHPVPEGYMMLARILAEAIAEELVLKDPGASPGLPPGGGVRVENLWRGGEDGHTRAPIIAGWYSLSFDVLTAEGNGGQVTLHSLGDSVQEPLKTRVSVEAAKKGERITYHFFTKYERYGYSRSVLGLTAEGCTVGRIMLEKQRPSKTASVYCEESCVDTETPPAPGELVEWP